MHQRFFMINFSSSSISNHSIDPEAALCTSQTKIPTLIQSAATQLSPRARGGSNEGDDRPSTSSSIKDLKKSHSFFPADSKYYSLGKTLGKGSFGNVKFAVLNDTFNEELSSLDTSYKQTRCAIKTTQAIENYYKIAIQEEKTVLFLNQEDKKHHIIKFHTGFDVEGQRWSVYELLDCDLATWVKLYKDQNMEVPTPLIIDFTRQMCAGLSYLKEKKIVHGDLKPANMGIIGSHLLLIDFGGAFHTDAPPSFSKTIVTAHYRDPAIICSIILKNENVTKEHIRLHKKYMTHSIDIWSMGCTVAYMCLGKHIITPPSCDYLTSTKYTPEWEIERHQLLAKTIAASIGAFPKKMWTEGWLSTTLPAQEMFNTCTHPKQLPTIIKNLQKAHRNLKRFIFDALQVDPQNRLEEPLTHALFTIQEKW